MKNVTHAPIRKYHVYATFVNCNMLKTAASPANIPTSAPRAFTPWSKVPSRNKPSKLPKGSEATVSPVSSSGPHLTNPKPISTKPHTKVMPRDTRKNLHVSMLRPQSFAKSSTLEAASEFREPLNSLAASSVLDFAKLWGRSIDTCRFLRVSRGMTLVWGFVLMGFGFVKWGPLLETGLTVASLPFGSLLGLFLLGTFDHGANALGALVGMFAGLAAVLSILQFTNVAYTWYFLIGSTVTFAVGTVASRLASNHPADVA